MGRVYCSGERDGSPLFEAQAATEAGCASIVEPLNDRLCDTREIVKHSDHWFSIRQFGFAKRYAEGICNLGFRRTFADKRQYGFILSAHPPRRDWLNRPSRNPEGHRSRLYANQPTMLAHDVEMMEGPQQFVPTFVWFQTFDNLSFGRGKPLYEFGSLVIPCGKSSGTVGDGEIRVFGLRHVVALGESCSEEIERAADGVDVGSDFDIEGERQRLFFDRYYHVMRGWRIRLFDTCADIEMEPGVDAIFEGFELGYGPVNACLSV
jgi:hypothetical protein